MLRDSKTRWSLCLHQKGFKNVSTFKNLFVDLLSELWPYILHAQALSFHEAALKGKGQTLSAVETAYEIGQPKDNLAQKLNNPFLFFICSLVVKLEDNGTDIDEEFVKCTATTFNKNIP